jgi:3-deoxy-manno-octulosonate cytidylyltransferase (CMP-KDO synthetase)
MIPQSLGVIPARLGSTRLPRKPLHLLAGRPLIEWVWRRVCEAAVFESVVIATDSTEVAEAARRFGARVELTSPAHPSGTDRVAEVAKMPHYRHFPLIVNVQGDEPFVRACDLRAAASLVSEQGWEVGTVAAPVRTSEELNAPSVVKVVRGAGGRALYFSRAPIPFSRDDEPTFSGTADSLYLRHAGLYAYDHGALLRWVALPEGDLERTERLEQLRPLAAGIGIGVAVVETVEGGIDTPADAVWAEQRLLQHLASGTSN